MKLRVMKKDWTNWIIYSAIFLLFAIFFILPSINFINSKFYNSVILITIKLLIGMIGVVVILTKYIKGYTEFITTIDINKNNVVSLKWALRRKNLKAFWKTTLSITPFLLLAIFQGLNLNNKISVEYNDNIYYYDGAAIYPGITEFAEEVSKSFITLFFEKLLNNNRKISFVFSLFIIGMIFSSFLMVIIYAIYKISMNNYFKKINKQFNRLSTSLNMENKDIMEENFIQMVQEKENKTKTMQNERDSILYTVLNKKYSDFLNEVKKSTTPPNFNLGI
ncbi:hypothetical protein [Spiroplasma floricola]|uniref:Uncharacterized protein n=1 Tax=Spiroplasma floricola 23-6 TaxID=1336749 RepID=A0A2K8SDZ0_9MOLU|nr:hypothetical protein [Spiroplasma floricola]AUB31669.1 hypothetical protein SFLOR_v1c06190 [Spiroplasma floricola 23-6]